MATSKSTSTAGKSSLVSEVKEPLPEEQAEANEVNNIIDREASGALEIPDEVTGLDLVIRVMTSLDGGVSGLNPFKQFSIVREGDGVVYTSTDRRTGESETFKVVISKV